MVDRTARYVAKDGTPFEQRLLDREAGNPDFAFLFEYESKEGQYYRWKVRHGTVRFGPVRYGSLRFGSARFGSLRFGSVRFGSARFGTVRFGSVRYGTMTRP